jgi:hypothetical protein
MKKESTDSRFRKLFLFAFVAMFACIVVPNASAQQGQTGPTGDLSVVGEVSVNGAIASTGDIVASGSTVETIGLDSRAVISLGRLGRVEVKGNTRMQLFYNETDRIISVFLDAGSVWVYAAPRVTSTVERR